jgi:hypothetical protein
MPTWQEFLTTHHFQDLIRLPNSGDDPTLVKLPQTVLDRTWGPTEKDQNAAWDLYTELRTRITTVPLRYQDGDEATALESIHSLFALTRELLHKHQRQCTHFGLLSVFMLNRGVRPFTAKWHKVLEGGGLTNEDTCRDFRKELLHLQELLKRYMRLLGHLAEGREFKEGSESGIDPAHEHDYDLGDAIAPTALFLIQDSHPDVWTREQLEIIQRRQANGLGHKGTGNLVGLAISGGGIRSATFALGVVQGLGEHGLFREVDYLSTVSGGGYLGGFLSSYLNSDAEEVGPWQNRLPFSKTARIEPSPIRYLRNHSKYLIEGNWIERVRTVGQMLYGILANLFVVCPFVVLLAILTIGYKGAEIRAAVYQHAPATFDWFGWLILGLLFALGLILGIVQNLGRCGPKLDKIRDKFERFTAVFLVFTALVALYELLPAIFSGYSRLMDVRISALPINLAVLVPLVHGTLLVLTQRYPTWNRVLLRLFWLTAPLAFIVLYLSLTLSWITDWHESPKSEWIMIPINLAGYPVPLYWIFLLDVGVIAYCFLFLNVNMTSPHRFYRDQLSETYLLKPANGSVKADELQKLSALNTQRKAPYHLINAALNLKGSSRSDLRGRETDFFLFSRHHCGSPVTGYQKTTNWEDADAHLNLGTAVAVSGAAAAPIMGMSSIAGAEFLLAVLNVRLAYWLRNPAKKSKFPWLLWLFGGPGPTYLLREMFGRIDENQRYLNVSDGGHLENLGIYELLRRQCKFIIAIDGECDPQMTFASLVRLIRFAEIDFGIVIDINLNPLRIDPAGMSKAHYAFGTIDYGPDRKGFLLYIKSSLTGNELEYVRSYRAKSPSFPHETTANQLFAEDQFEAYRALGHHALEALFREELHTANDANITITEWFQRLANSLLPH